jgi:hypothetical protein
MKFLTKDRNSVILAERLVYKEGDSRSNRRLSEKLLAEQKGFCAYTEKRVSGLDSVDVEHFDRSKKGHDDYFNYYAVLHGANLHKIGKEKRHEGAAFFASLFFQDPVRFARRVRYVPGDAVYEETVEGDDEAASFIDFLGFNDSCLFDERVQHVRMLKDLFRDRGASVQQKIDWLTAHPEHLSFVTAVEAELGINLSAIVAALP